MRIAVNGRFLLQKTTGVERYAHNVLRHLVPLCAKRGHQIEVIAPPLPSEHAQLYGAPVNQVGQRWFSHSAPARHLWEQLVLPNVCRSLNADVLLNLTNTAPIAFSPKIITVHDVAWLARPQWFSVSFRLAYKFFVEPAIATASKIVTVSKFSEREIVQRLNIDPSRIVVAPNGVAEELRVASSALDSVLDGLGVHPPYFLHVASVDPRKNLATVLRAVAIVAASGKPVPTLVCVGARNPHFAQTGDLSAQGIKYLGHVDDEQLSALYEKALAVVCASLYEGFGLPVIEAMAAGVPVIASRIPPHEEVAGDAALFFRAEDADELAERMNQIAGQGELRAELARKGKERATLFSFQRHAEKLLDIVEETCTGKTN